MPISFWNFDILQILNNSEIMKSKSKDKTKSAQKATQVKSKDVKSKRGFGVIKSISLASLSGIIAPDVASAGY